LKEGEKKGGRIL